MLGLAVTAQPFVRVLLGARWMPVAGAVDSVFAPLGGGPIDLHHGRPDLQHPGAARSFSLALVDVCQRDVCWITCAGLALGAS